MTSGAISAQVGLAGPLRGHSLARAHSWRSRPISARFPHLFLPREVIRPDRAGRCHIWRRRLFLTRSRVIGHRAASHLGGRFPAYLGETNHGQALRRSAHDP
jgi:hypothetical protein